MAGKKRAASAKPKSSVVAPEQPKTPQQLEAEKAEQEYTERKKQLDEKVKQVEAEAREVEQLRREQIRRVVSGFQLSEPELNAILAVFKDMPGAGDIGVRIMNVAESNKVADLNNLVTKLVRMGLL